MSRAFMAEMVIAYAIYRLFFIFAAQHWTYFTYFSEIDFIFKNIVKWNDTMLLRMFRIQVDLKSVDDFQAFLPRSCEKMGDTLNAMCERQHMC